MKVLAKISIGTVLKIIYEICSVYCSWYEKHEEK